MEQNYLLYYKPAIHQLTPSFCGSLMFWVEINTVRENKKVVSGKIQRCRELVHLSAEFYNLKTN